MSHHTNPADVRCSACGGPVDYTCDPPGAGVIATCRTSGAIRACSTRPGWPGEPCRVDA